MERGCYFLWALPPELPREPPEDDPRPADPEEPRDDEPREAPLDDLPEEDEPTRAPLERPEEGFEYVPPDDVREAGPV